MASQVEEESAQHVGQVARAKAVAAFVGRWRGKGDEKQDTQRFWIDLLTDVAGLRDATRHVEFEHRTAGRGFIDVRCADAWFLVEQKSPGVDLDKPETRQGTPVTPIEQAKRYADALPPSLRPTVLCTCNFGLFRFYDLEADPLARTPSAAFTLEELPGNVTVLASIFGESHSRVVAKAGDGTLVVGLIAFVRHLSFEVADFVSAARAALTCRR